MGLAILAIVHRSPFFSSSADHPLLVQPPPGYQWRHTPMGLVPVPLPTQHQALDASVLHARQLVQQKVASIVLA